VSAFIATAFAQDDAGAAKAQWRQVADQVPPKLPKLAALLDKAEEDVLAYMAFPKEHRAKIHSTNPLERVKGEIKRRTEVVGIFPNEAAITRPVGAILLEQNDIERITITPRDDGTGLEVLLYGDLARMLQLCEAGERTSQRPGRGGPGRGLSVVAGACNTLCLLLFATRLIGRK
jgi:hypothetical protein